MRPLHRVVLIVTEAALGNRVHRKTLPRGWQLLYSSTKERSVSTTAETHKIPSTAGTGVPDAAGPGGASINFNVLTVQVFVNFLIGERLQKTVGVLLLRTGVHSNSPRISSMF